jgi:uncharacterized glyoxalase superfamily protein PhnB
MTECKLTSAVPQLPSGDIEVTAEFFKSKLGFEVIALYREQKHLILRRGAAEVQFWQTDTEENGRHYGSASSCYIRVENLDQLYAEFTARGVEFRFGLVKQAWGMYEMQIDDPYGNAIRFGEDAD